MRTGGRSEFPQGYMWPLAAQVMMSCPRYPAYGPVCPNGVTETMMMPGLIARRAS